MPDKESTMKWKVDISQLKSGMAEARRAISQANADFGKATAALDKWQTSTTGVEAKIKQLTATEQSQQKILDLLKQQYSAVAKELGATSPEAERLAIKITEQETKCIKTRSEIEKYTGKLAEMKNGSVDTRNAAEKLTDKISEQDGKLKELKTQYEAAVLEYGKNSTEAKALAKEIKSLSGELADNKSKMSAAEKAADELDKSVDEAGQSADKAANGGFTVLKGALANLVSQGISLAISGLKKLASNVLETGMGFESSMANVAALSGATGDELQLLTDTAREYGKTTVFSASEAADALGYMALAGWDAEKSAAELGGVLNLAAASGMGLAEASDMVTDYLSAFSNSAMSATEFSDKLAYAQANSNTSAQQLGEAYKNCAANMNAAGQSVDTTTALLASLANQGLKGSRAGTALSAMMRDMTAKMEKGSIQIGKTKIAVQDANGDYRNMTDILADVEKAVDGMGSAERAAALSSVFTSDSIKGLNLILNDGVDNAKNFAAQLMDSDVYILQVADSLKLTEEQTAQFSEAIKACGDDSEAIAKVAGEFGLGSEEALQFANNLGAAQGAAAEMSKTMNDNLSGDIKELQSAWDELNLVIYDSANGSLRSVVQQVTSKVIPAVTDLVNNVDGAGKKVGEAVSGLLTTAITKVGEMLPTVVEIGSSLVTNLVLGCMESVPLLIEQGAIAISALLSGLSSGIPMILEQIPAFITEIVTALMGDGLPMILQSGIEFIMALLDGVKLALPALIDALPVIVDSISEFLITSLPMILDAALTLFMGIVSAIPLLIQKLEPALPKIINTIIKLLIDSTPMLLKAAVQLLMAIIQALPTIIRLLVVQVPQIVNTIISVLIDNLPLLIQAAVQLFFGILEAIPQICFELGRQMPEIITAIVEGLSSGFGAMHDIGFDLIAGVWEGIKGSYEWIKGKIEGWVGNVVDFMAGLFGIHSPSTVMADRIGQFLAPGIVKGNDRAMPKAKRDLQKSMNSMVSELKTGFDVSLDGNSKGSAYGVGSSGRVVGSQNVVFNQYNNSPKALDRLTVYKQTNSLLFSAKVRLANV